MQVLAWAAAVKLIVRPSPGHYCTRSAEAMRAACDHGRIQVVQWLLERGCKWKGDLFTSAERGHLHFLRWVNSNAAHLRARMPQHFEKGLSWDPAMPAAKDIHGWTFMEGAAAGGHLHILEWIVGTLKPRGPHLLQIAFAAAENGHLDILTWVHSRGTFESAKLCQKAAQGSNLDCLQWVHQNGYPLEGRHLMISAQSLPVLQWLLQQGCEWAGGVYREAVRAGRLEIMKWAHQQGLPFPPLRCWWAEPEPGTPQAAALQQHDPTGIRLPRGDFLQITIRWGHVP